MKSISLDSFIFLIKEYINKRIEPDPITIRDFYKGRKVFIVEIDSNLYELSNLESPEKRTYDMLFENLKNVFKAKTFRVYQRNYGHRFMLIINKIIILEFKYSLPEGKFWVSYAYENY